MESSRRGLLMVLVFAFIFDLIIANSMSQTMDEADHLEYGAKILHGEPDRSGPFMDTKTPVTALNALPRAIAARLGDNTSPRIRKFFNSRTLARFPSILATLGLIFFIHQLTFEMYGRAAALAAAWLAALSPYPIAHGTLATTDGYFALGVVASLYFFRRYLQRPGFTTACASGLSLSLAQVMKPFALFLYAIVAVFVIVAAVRRSPREVTGKQLVAYLGVTALCLVVVLNVAYVFDRTFVPLGSYAFESSPFRQLQSTPLLRDMRIPVPYPVLQGLDMEYQHNQNGATYGNIYLLGTLGHFDDADFHGFKSYYVVAWLIKEPIALQILFIWGVTVAMGRKNDFLFAGGLLIATAATLVVGMSLFSRTQIGIRHILPALAIEVILAAAAFSGWRSFSLVRWFVLASLVIWVIDSPVGYFPRLMLYMNL